MLRHVPGGLSVECGGVGGGGLAAGLSRRSGGCLLPRPVLAHVWRVARFPLLLSVMTHNLFVTNVSHTRTGPG